MPIEIRLVRSRSDSETYIRLPFHIYSNWKEYVPPLLKDERRFHDPKHNRGLLNSYTIRLLAILDGQAVGRVMGIISHGYNLEHHEQDVRFFQFDCIENKQVAEMLLRHVTEWGRAMGMKRIIGPFGFSEKDPQGIQIEGSKCAPVIASATTPAYIQRMIEEAGFTKFKDCVSYVMEIPEVLPPLYKRICERLSALNDYEIVSLKKRSDLKPHFKDVLLLLNKGYENIYGFVPLSDEDIQHMADEYLDFIDPRFVKFIRKTSDREIIAFVLAMPNLAEGFRKAKGRLFPFGFIHLIKCLKSSKKLDLLLGAVHPKHQGKGLTALLAVALMEEASKAGMAQLDSHLILEENKLMCAEMTRLGAGVTKRYRIFQKTL
ncbi:MAG: hypothetical protein ACU4F9_04040 [Arcticibacter sp.]